MVRTARSEGAPQKETKMRKAIRLSGVVSALALFMSAAAPDAYAQSSKAAWRFTELAGLSASSGGVTDTGWQTILTTHIKTPNAKELAIGVSLQCGIVTDTTVKSSGGTSDTAAAQSRIAVQVKITQPDGTVVYAEPDNAVDDLSGDILASDVGVTYCERYQKLAAKFAGLNCFVDLLDSDGDGNVLEVICADPEELQLILKTMTAHHFNFIHANAIPGVHKVEVQARARAAILLGGSSAGLASAEAFAGAGALYVETIRLVKDANGTTDLENLK